MEPTLRVISLNVGLPREIDWKGAKVLTGIFKQPIAGPVRINRFNLDGDQQADLTVHGGADKAIYAYPAEHYAHWRKEIPEIDFGYGNFGENLTTEGLTEETVCIGDRIQVGTAVLVITQPRMPCYKLGLRFERDDMIKRFLISKRSGFYFKVVAPGTVTAGSEMAFLSRDPNHVSVSDILRLYLGPERDPRVMEQVQQLEALPESWKAELLARTQAHRPY